MAKIAVILPHDELEFTIHPLSRSLNIDPPTVISYNYDYAEIPSLVEKARRLNNEIILSRGLIAARVRQCCDIPVVEMRITAQEMGLLIHKAKGLTNKQTPAIAIIGTSNMFCDYSKLGELFNVKLTSYWVPADASDPYLGLENQTRKAIEDSVDVIIGGKTACAIAQTDNIPSVFLLSTTDSLLEGLRVASRVSDAVDQKKNTLFEVQAMLDCSSSILIRFDKDGLITTVNRTAATRLGELEQDICGRPLLSLIKGLPQNNLQRVLSTGVSISSAFVTISNEQFVASLTAVRASDGIIVGGVVSCDEINRIETVSVDIRRKMHSQHGASSHFFDELPFTTEAHKKLRLVAEQYALSDSPIFLQSETGCYPKIIAECIHNASNRNAFPFVSIDCGELSPEEQPKIIFGDDSTDAIVSHSRCAAAHLGTLHLHQPELLCPQAQSRLLRLISDNCLFDIYSGRKYPIDVRIISSTELTNEQWRNLSYNKELSYRLCALPLLIPPLRHSEDHTEYVFKKCLAHYLKKFNRRLTITADGLTWVRAQKWPGNYVQINHFCELLSLAAPQQSLNKRLLSALYAKHVMEKLGDSTAADISPEAERIAEALTRNLGDRSATAKELGISTSTLWRKINKYNLLH